MKVRRFSDHWQVLNRGDVQAHIWKSGNAYKAASRWGGGSFEFTSFIAAFNACKPNGLINRR